MKLAECLVVEIVELVQELRRNENPDILHAITVLAQTGITFSPLLQGLISEIMQESSVHAQELAVDMESGLLQHDELRRRDEQTMDIPNNDLWMVETNDILSQLGMDGDWNTNTSIYSLLEEVVRGGNRRN